MTANKAGKGDKVTLKLTDNGGVWQTSNDWLIGLASPVEVSLISCSKPAKKKTLGGINAILEKAQDYTNEAGTLVASQQWKVACTHNKKIKALGIARMCGLNQDFSHLSGTKGVIAVLKVNIISIGK